MKPETIGLEQALSLVKQLSPLEKVQLIEKIIPDLEAVLQVASAAAAPAKPPLRSVYGLCTNLGEAPTAQEIDETRREFLHNFPQEDI